MLNVPLRLKTPREEQRFITNDAPELLLNTLWLTIPVVPVDNESPIVIVPLLVKVPLFLKPCLVDPFTLNEPDELTVKVALFSIKIDFAFAPGVLIIGIFDTTGIFTVSAKPGTPASQLPLLFQSVLTLPVHVFCP